MVKNERFVCIIGTGKIIYSEKLVKMITQHLIKLAFTQPKYITFFKHEITSHQDSSHKTRVILH